MKKVIISIFLVLITWQCWACPVCDRQQKGILSGITHGSGPQSNWDYLIMAVMIVIVVATLIASVKMLVRPGEKGDKHIKRIVLNFE